MAKVKTETLIDALCDTLKVLDAKTQSDTLANLKTEALLDGVADMFAEMKAGTLKNSLGECEGERTYCSSGYYAI